MKTKIVIGVLLFIAVAVGVFFGIRYERNVYKALVLHNQRINIMDDFLTKTFPNEVKAYRTTGKPSASPLPTNVNKK